MLTKAFIVLAALFAPAEALVVGARLAPASGALRAPLSGIRAEEPASPPPGSRLGGTVDQDGKSNVWAVEPSMKVETKDKGVLAFAPVIGVAGLAVLSVPLLPLLFAANPDQA